jgi:large subunit ribosomal protein L18
MADSPIYRVRFRRRREGKTDYARRLAVVKSGSTRLVVRKSLASVYAQLVNFEPAGDKTLAAASGTDLKKFGWKGGLGNLPAAYLVGYLAGKRGSGKTTETVILDIGLQRPVKGGRLFAALKGAIDAGMNVSCDESVFPTKERLEGTHIKGAPSTFSSYKKNGLDPAGIPANFSEVKAKIDKTGGKA